MRRGFSGWNAIGLALAGLAMAATTVPQPACEQAWRGNHWCAAAKVGYVAGVEIKSRFLFEALDAHGHQIVRSAVTCDTCRKALDSHGYCAFHRMGYVGGHAFMTPLTYYLARSTKIDPAAITCPVCREHVRGIGWCDRDRVGMAGPFALRDRQEFDEMQKAYAILLLAVDTSARCERCAAAIVADGYCAIHRIQYKDGKALSIS